MFYFVIDHMLVFYFFYFFFFQADDVIRDLVRSRGLGDVYMRQVKDMSTVYWHTTAYYDDESSTRAVTILSIVPVSYTNLTLPTNLRV